MKLKSGFLPLALALTVSTASYGAQKNESEKVIDIVNKVNQHWQENNKAESKVLSGTMRPTTQATWKHISLLAMMHTGNIRKHGQTTISGWALRKETRRGGSIATEKQKTMCYSETGRFVSRHT